MNVIKITKEQYERYTYILKELGKEDIKNFIYVTSEFIVVTNGKTLWESKNSNNIPEGFYKPIKIGKDCYLQFIDANIDGYPKMYKRVIPNLVDYEQIHVSEFKKMDTPRDIAITILESKSLLNYEYFTPIKNMRCEIYAPINRSGNKAIYFKFEDGLYLIMPMLR